MSQHTNFPDSLQSVITVDMLLALDGRQFIEQAYQTLLGRAPDAGGFLHYSAMLTRSAGKLRVLADLRQSDEGLRYAAAVHGLDERIARHRRHMRSPLQRVLTLLEPRPAARPAAQGASAQSPAPASVTPQPPAPAPQPQAPVVPPAVVASGKVGTARVSKGGTPTFWFDLTTSMEWTGGVVGIVRAELEIAYGLKKIDPAVRFSMQKGNGFVEIPEAQLGWLFDADNVVDAYMHFFDRYRAAGATEASKARNIVIDLPEPSSLHHPYGAGDVVVSVGWMDSQKEAYFERVKAAFPEFFVVYLVYDIILLRPETRHLYSEIGQNKFEGYLKWISENVDFMLFGGETAKRDTRELQARMKWPSPPGQAVKFGSDIVKLADSGNDEAVLREIGITGPFIITVGSIEPRKNHDTLYRAYLIAQTEQLEGMPQLVICGRVLGQVGDLVDSLDRDPRLVGKVIRLSPTDKQLAVLYKHCRFTALPTLYEGWSLTLPESLSQHKFCLSADTPPLREIGRDLVDYVAPWDARSWAEKIHHYANDDAALRAYQQRIVLDWTITTWRDTARAIHENVNRFVVEQRVPARKPPEIWMDLSLTYLHWQGGVNGIIRAELTLARHLHELAPKTHYFAQDGGHMFEIPHDMLLWLFNDDDLSTAYQHFNDFWNHHERQGSGFRSPFRATGGVHADHPALLEAFPENSIVFFAGIEWEQKLMSAAARASREHEAVIASQLVYDLTPLLVPHLHQPETCEGYERFFEFASQQFDQIVYGGRTALRDGERIQRAHGWNTPRSDFVEFGSDINVVKESEPEHDQAVLERLGVGRDFVMTVGTIQPRKNHDTLYKAYVTLFERGVTELPKLVFVGKEGWKSTDFLTILRADARMKDRIVMVSPTDEELDVLYRHCRFTLLPSFYEGWSLTLPESLSYGKFCLTADTDPLRETGRDLVEYVDPHDTFAWAERIGHYLSHPREVERYEQRIRAEWKPRSWKDATKMLLDALYAAHAEKLRASLAAKAAKPVTDAAGKGKATGQGTGAAAN
ncbi:glycosyltransferase [Burkholderia plantarii]|uniref:Glycosyl transferase, group 1 n=1 Tax=Burkholderia plantarii TaxID=41899 RepID=A0A0B6RVT5_BURPL|nr:glycosyltransferase [Burkholderia plantarii]AJK45175.1 glycosyl transferase, group 1 [Burkholderia plantarii]